MLGCRRRWGILGLAAVTALGVRADWTFELEAASAAPLSNPHDLCLSPDGRYLYVADVGHDRVAVLDAHTLALIDAFGEDRLRAPHDLALGRDGRLYVADTENGRIAIFTLQGTSGTLSGELRGRVDGPEGVLVHPNGRVYATGAWSDNVVAYRDGRVEYELRGLAAPHDLALAPDGRIWLADARNDRLLLLSESLEIVAERRGTPYDFDGVRYLDVLADGSVVASDKFSHSIKVIADDGRLLATLGQGRRGRGAGLFANPEGVAAAGESLWLSDSGNDRVVRYRFRADASP